MDRKKYIIKIILTIVLFLSLKENVYAKEACKFENNCCEYIINDTEGNQQLLKIDYSKNEVKSSIYINGKESKEVKLKNWENDGRNNPYKPINDDGASDIVGKVYVSSVKKCPDKLFLAESKGERYAWLYTNDSQIETIKKSSSIQGDFTFINGNLNPNPVATEDEQSDEQSDGDRDTLTGEALDGDIMGDQGDTSLTCEDVISDGLRDVINQILTYMSIAIVVLLIVLGTIDFTKAVAASDQDAIKKAQGTFVKRIIIAVIFFFLPILVNLVLGFINSTWSTCGFR